jgi:hypothetical protein
MSPKVALITVNWNGKKFLQTCFDALQQQAYDNFDIFFVDNGSTDGSIDFVKQNFPKTKIISLDHNTGFAFPNNRAFTDIAKNKEYKYVITLNNDTKVQPNFISEMVTIAERDEKIGAVQPKVKFFYEPNLIDNTGIVIAPDGGGMNRGFKEEDKGQYEKEEEVFGPCAGASLYRVSAIEKTSFFDEKFFAYYEDLDLAWRLRYYGYKTIYTPKTTVSHVHSATAISHSPFKAFFVQRNRLLVIVKNFPAKLLFYSLFYLTVKRYFHLLNSALFKKKGPSYKLREKTGMGALFAITIKAWASFLTLIPHCLNQRKKIPIKKELVNEWFKKYSVDLDKMIYL